MKSTESSRRQQQPGPQRGRFQFRFEYLLLAVVLGFCGWKFVERIQEVRRLQAQELALQIQNAETARQNTGLQLAIRYYRTPQYIESEARSRLGYTLPGEVSIETRPNSPVRVSVRPAPPRTLLPPQPSWERWWHAFF